jgi:S-DNA-T family DNA segregation ATPase FtsK/SpoIIIE
MNPRADFPPTTFDDEDAEPGGVNRKHPGSAKGGLTAEPLRRPLRNAIELPLAGSRPDGLATGGIKVGGGDPLARREGFVPPHSAGDPLEKLASNVKAQRGSGFKSVRLVSLSGPDLGKSFPVVAAGALIGRHPSCQIVIDDRRVSGRHAWLGIALGKVILRDLQSTNGTRINAHPNRVIGETELHAGDTICFGGHKGVEFKLLID